LHAFWALRCRIYPASDGVTLIYSDYKSSAHSVLGIDVVREAPWDTRDCGQTSGHGRREHQVGDNCLGTSSASSPAASTDTEALLGIVHVDCLTSHAISSSKPQGDCICVMRTIESRPLTVALLRAIACAFARSAADSRPTFSVVSLVGTITRVGETTCALLLGARVSVPQFAFLCLALCCSWC
jgi:hypothetical protein